VILLREFPGPPSIRLAALERHVAQTGDVLTEAQAAALYKNQDDDAAHGENEIAHPGYPAVKTPSM